MATAMRFVTATFSSNVRLLAVMLVLAAGLSGCSQSVCEKAQAANERAVELEQKDGGSGSYGERVDALNKANEEASALLQACDQENQGG